MAKGAIVTREEDFPRWYQEVIAGAEMADNGPARGTMVIRPWGYGIWELMQAELDRRIKEAGAENAYFPLFIPEAFLKLEAEHVEGFAPELAVVTHGGGKELEEPLVVRPTSETVINSFFAKWVQSHRDLPLLVNQWANVVRWELRPRLFLRTSEFLWQEGHTAHATFEDARAYALRILDDVYRSTMVDVLGIPVLTGHKTPRERFAGAIQTWTCEGMMGDGKALQMGTSHELGQNFAVPFNITFTNASGTLEHVWQTSWGVSTRLVGAVVMTHGDDDGLRLPPAIAPKQIVLVPILRDRPEDGGVIEYCESLAAQLCAGAALGEPIRASVDRRAGRSVDKRWGWVKRGVPIVCEIGARDVAAGVVTLLRRDRARSGEKLAFSSLERTALVERAPALLAEIQDALRAEAANRLRTAIRSDLATLAQIEEYFGQSEESESFRGWVEVPWARPQGAALEAVERELKRLKLTVRVVPLDSRPIAGESCLFTGAPAKERILVARAY